MTEMKTFSTAVKRHQDADDPKPIEFRLDKRDDEGNIIEHHDVKAYLPDDSQFAYLLANVGRGSSSTDRIAGFVNFFVNILDRPSANYIEARLLDRDDPFGIDEVEDIVEWLTEQWTGNPTQEPSGSAPSPQNDGPKSTQPLSLST
jgi:hypothetical protein